MIRPNYFERIGGVLKRFLALEPAVIAGFVRAIVYLGATLGFILPNDLGDRVVGVFVALVAVVEIGMTIYTRAVVTPTVKVVEQIAADGESVVAGPANQIVNEGDHIRLFDEALTANGNEHPPTNPPPLPGV